MSQSITIAVGPELFRFASRSEWINKSTSWFSAHGATSLNTVCVDQVGRVCRMGRDFERALYPVVVYRKEG